MAARRESALDRQRGGKRHRSKGAGRKPKPEFVDRLLVTLVRLRLGLPHAALAELYRVDRSTVPVAVRQVGAAGSQGGRVHDQTALRTEGIAEQFQHYPAVKAEADSGYQGLATPTPSTSSGGPCSGAPDVGRPARKPTWPSPG
ncbi:transposase family protein [Streptoverticillium reticulum]|uniref:transposase family protein n=1 Tax=Streptoverticillium reticulum TaxID=1433415 RepID=UPI0039BF3854